MLVYYVIGLLFILSMLLIWHSMLKASQASHLLVIQQQKEMLLHLLHDLGKAREFLTQTMREELTGRRARPPEVSPQAEAQVAESGFGQI